MRACCVLAHNNLYVGCGFYLLIFKGQVIEECNASNLSGHYSAHRFLNSLTYIATKCSSGAIAAYYVKMFLVILPLQGKLSMCEQMRDKLKADVAKLLHIKQQMALDAHQQIEEMVSRDI